MPSHRNPAKLRPSADYRKKETEPPARSPRQMPQAGDFDFWASEGGTGADAMLFLGSASPVEPYGSTAAGKSDGVVISESSAESVLADDVGEGAFPRVVRDETCPSSTVQTPPFGGFLAPYRPGSPLRSQTHELSADTAASSSSPCENSAIPRLQPPQPYPMVSRRPGLPAGRAVAKPMRCDNVIRAARSGHGDKESSSGGGGCGGNVGDGKWVPAGAELFSTSRRHHESTEWSFPGCSNKGSASTAFSFHSTHMASYPGVRCFPAAPIFVPTMSNASDPILNEPARGNFPDDTDPCGNAVASTRAYKDSLFLCGDIRGNKESPTPEVRPPMRVNPFVLERRQSLFERVPLSAAAAAGDFCCTKGTNAVDGASGRGPRITQHVVTVQQGDLEGNVEHAATRIISLLESAYDVKVNIFTTLEEQAYDTLLRDFAVVRDKVEHAMRAGPAILHLRSPVLCCGDLHGSFFDLHTILHKAAPFGHWSLLRTPVLFLGDYVDRGLYSVQVVLFLFAWAALQPEMVYLLRGNHEDPDVNGDMELHGDSSFLAKAQTFFGAESGTKFWRDVNRAFTLMPIAAVIDLKVFACHGGVPKLLVPKEGDGYNVVNGLPTMCLLEDLIGYPGNDELTRFPAEQVRFATLTEQQSDWVKVSATRRLVRELLWNAPASTPAESPQQQSCADGAEAFDKQGFRRNLTRDDILGRIHEFNKTALMNFLTHFNFSILVCAHRQKQLGVEMLQGGRIVTLFSCCDYVPEKRSCAVACYVLGDEVTLISWHQVEPNLWRPPGTTTGEDVSNQQYTDLFGSSTTNGSSPDSEQAAIIRRQQLERHNHPVVTCG